MKQFQLRRLLLAALFALSLAAVMSAVAQTNNEPTNAADLQWGPGPDFLPPGAQMVILDGNPAEAKQLTLRLKFPAGYELPAHWHPTQENVTVLSGTIYAGMGDKLDKSKGTALTPGGYIAIPATMHHFLWTEGEAIVQVDLIGPFAITYVDPTTDPRNK